MFLSVLPNSCKKNHNRIISLVKIRNIFTLNFGMQMQGPSSLSTIFVAIAVIFICVALRDFAKEEGKATIARKIRLRAGVHFYGHGV